MIQYKKQQQKRRYRISNDKWHKKLPTKTDNK